MACRTLLLTFALTIKDYGRVWNTPYNYSHGEGVYPDTAADYAHAGVDADRVGARQIFVELETECTLFLHSPEVLSPTEGFVKSAERNNGQPTVDNVCGLGA